MDTVIEQLYKWMCPRGAIDSPLSAQHCSFAIVMENPSPVSARPSWAAKFGQKMHFDSPPLGAHRKRQTEGEEEKEVEGMPRLCPTIDTSPTLRLAQGSVKIIKTPSSFCVERWSHWDAIMPSGDGAKIHSGRNYCPTGGGLPGSGFVSL